MLAVGEEGVLGDRRKCAHGRHGSLVGGVPVWTVAWSVTVASGGSPVITRGGRDMRRLSERSRRPRSESLTPPEFA